MKRVQSALHRVGQSQSQSRRYTPDQQTSSDDSWLSGRHAPGDMRHIKVPEYNRSSVVGRLPTVDYLAKMEEVYGPKESWHRADERFMRAMIPLLCRKVDDMRTRLADTHRYHAQYRSAAKKELSKIPLYKREAWMSPDLTRSLIIDELASKGYLDSDGKLKDISDLLAEHTDTTTPLPPSPPKEALEESFESTEESEITIQETPTPNTDITPEYDFTVESPLVIDPLLHDVHAPHQSTPPAGIPVATQPHYAPLGVSKVRDLADATGGIPSDVNKVWVELEDSTVQATIGSEKMITEINVLDGAAHYRKPRRRYGRSGIEINEDPTERKQQKISQGEGEKEVEREEDEEEEEEGDAVMKRLVEEKQRRRAHQSAIWEKVKEPKIKPGEMLHSIVTESVKDDDSTLLAKIDKAEKIVTSSEMEFDLTSKIPTRPMRGPDAVDETLEATSEMSRAAALRVNRERVQMERQMKPHLVTGARLVSTVPTSPDQMKFQHDRATADGMWYTISKEAGVAGHPIGGGRWPKQGAVLVPFEVHESLKKSGYEGIRAHQILLEMTDVSNAVTKQSDDDEDAM